MKKKIKWVIKDSKDREQSAWGTRAYARAEVKWLNQIMFEPWVNTVEFPVRIEREEWLLVSSKVCK